MNLRKTVLVSLVLAGSFLGCGGNASPPASPASDTGEAPGTTSSTAGSSEASASDSGSSKTADTGLGEIKTGLQTLEKRTAALEFDLNLSKKGAGSGIQHGEWSFAEERTLESKGRKTTLFSNSKSFTESGKPNLCSA